MIVNREQDVCHGRGFDEGHANKGWLENFYRWVTRAPEASPSSKSSGGPGWYIIDDQHDAGSDPYIVVSNHQAATVAADPNNVSHQDDPHIILQVGLYTTISGRVFIKHWGFWDASGHEGWLLIQRALLYTYDDADFVYDFRGGPTFMSLATRRGSTWEMFTCGKWTADSVLCEDTTVCGAFQAGVSAGSDVAVQLGAGEAANFTENGFYYVMDIDNNGGAYHCWVNYVKVTEVNTYTDVVHLQQIRHDFPAGTIIAAYPIRLYNLADRPEGGSTSRRIRIPMCSSKSTDGSDWSYCISDGTSNQTWDGRGAISCYLDNNTTLLTHICPDDVGNYAIQRGYLVEEYKGDTASDAGDMNRAYGSPEEIYVSSNENIAKMLDGREYNSRNYIRAYDGLTGSDTIILIPDYDSIV